MLRNYVKTAFRFLWKNRTFSLINIFGLALGTLCCLYIMLYVDEQYSYDDHHHNVKDIYRVTTSLKHGDNESRMATTSPPIAQAMKNDLGEVLEFTRVVNTFIGGATQHLLRHKEKSLYETDAYYVDSTFFNVFSYHFVHGHPAKALPEPYSVVLLQTTAEKLFGKENPVGKIVQMDNAFGKHDFTVTGVVNESLGRSHIRANLFISMNSGGIGDYVRASDNWVGNNFVAAYVRLHPSADAAALEKKFPSFLTKYGREQLKALGTEKTLHLQPVNSIHTTTGYEAEMGKAVSPRFLYVLVVIAALIQLIACINFMNLSTARASKRAKEVGVRKVAGATKIDFLQQFLGESIILSFIGVLIALALFSIALPYLNQITQADIHFSFLADYRVWLMLLILVIVTGLLAGSYPAIYLSAFEAAKVIKGNFTNHISASGIRRSLVVFQFVLSIVLIAAIIVIYSQLNFIKNKDLGFDKDQQLAFTFHTEDTRSKIPAFTNYLRQLPEVTVVSQSSHYLSQLPYDRRFYPPGGNWANTEGVAFIQADEFFTSAAGIKIISGRAFHHGDSGKVLINETLARKMRLDPQTVAGTRLYSQYSDTDPTPYSVEIAGVIRDFNYSSLHQDVRPFLIMYSPGPESSIVVRSSTTDYSALLNKIEKAWKRLLPSTPFEYVFVDDEVQRQYETDITLSKIINAFTLVAILISCLGLFGLAAFSTEQRMKEISVRKILGASVPSIIQVLSADFLKLVSLAIVIAMPIAWWAMTKWLEGFAYQVAISWWMFAAAGLIAIFIALFTISFQTVKAAMANPVRNLRTE